MKTKTKNEIYAEKWFLENGFEYRLVKQYISKTKYVVIKDGIEDSFELPYDVSDIKSFMSQYLRSFKLLKELKELRKCQKENI